MSHLPEELATILEDFAQGHARLCDNGHFVVDRLRGWSPNDPKRDVPNRVEEVLTEIAPIRRFENRNLLFGLINYVVMAGAPDPEVWTVVPDDARERRDRITSASFVPSEFHREETEKFARACEANFTLSDETLKAGFRDAFEVRRKRLLDLDRSVIYTKLNHGYWEYFLNSHIADLPATAEQRGLRVIGNLPRIEGERESGFYIQLLRLIQEHQTAGADSGPVELSVGIGAGANPVDTMLSQPLGTSERGALMGMLAAHGSIMEGRRFRCSDGEAPRRMLFDGEFETFLKRFMAGKACSLIIAPDELRQAWFPEFDGAQENLRIPNVTVHETWPSVLSVALGRIERLIDRHGEVIVFVQAANFASLLALSLPLALPREKLERLTFFDLGRVLDVCIPKKAERHGSFRSLTENPKEDYHRFYRLGKA